MGNSSKRVQFPKVPWGRSYTAAELKQANKALARRGLTKRERALLDNKKKKKAGGKGG